MAQVIWQVIDLRYHPSSVWHILRQLGWSNQRPQRVALQRDEQAVAHWKRYVWPQIKKVAPTGRTLVFEDESGFSLVSPLKRTWAPRGHTPRVRTSIQHHPRRNLLGAVLVSPTGRRLRLSVRSHWRSLRGER